MDDFFIMRVAGCFLRFRFVHIKMVRYNIQMDTAGWGHRDYVEDVQKSS